MTVTSTPTFSVHLWLVLRTLLRRTWMLIPFCLLACFSYALAPLVYRGTISTLIAYRDCAPVLILPALLVLLYTVQVWGAWQQWNRNPPMREPRTYTFSDAGIRMTARTFDSEISWELILKARRRGEHVLLGTHGHAFHVIPIAGFATPQHYAWFAALTAFKVRDCRL